jgi:hypothetical protein
VTTSSRVTHLETANNGGAHRYRTRNWKEITL